MTVYYLEVLKDNVSICLDSDVHYHHQFNTGDVITIHMYSDKGPKLVLGRVEYDAEFTIDWDKVASARLFINDCITKGYLVDVTKLVHRQEKLNSLGI
jgi:predicted RNA-binding protein (virulence factor B family)